MGCIMGEKVPMLSIHKFYSYPVILLVDSEGPDQTADMQADLQKNVARPSTNQTHECLIASQMHIHLSHQQVPSIQHFERCDNKRKCT